ncbi:hypothetical protein FAGKG844_100032 [Frankia sp. AgKG'84/4]
MREAGVDALLLGPLGEDVVVQRTLFPAVTRGVPPARGDLRGGVLRSTAVVPHDLAPFLDLPKSPTQVIAGAVRSGGRRGTHPLDVTGKTPGRPRGTPRVLELKGDLRAKYRNKVVMAAIWAAAAAGGGISPSRK